jgi:hypothetical protein
MDISNNATWQDAVQFGDPTDTTWNLVGQNFIMDVKGNKDDPTPLLTLSTANGTIVIADTIQRVIYMNVDEDTIEAALGVGCYVYDCIMFDTHNPPVRVQIMHGKVTVSQGITED